MRITLNDDYRNVLFIGCHISSSCSPRKHDSRDTMHLSVSATGHMPWHDSCVTSATVTWECFAFVKVQPQMLSFPECTGGWKQCLALGSSCTGFPAHLTQIIHTIPCKRKRLCTYTPGRYLIAPFLFKKINDKRFCTKKTMWRGLLAKLFHPHSFHLRTIFTA